VLTDETAQSWAENVVQALKDRGATIIGSPTAGAMTGTTNFDIPGNITLWLSEADLLLPNGKSLQRSGVQPDISVRPSIKGLQAGKDEVLERAVRFLQTGR
jgi:C-terminal processing protease CtpA/Prc